MFGDQTQSNMVWLPNMFMLNRVAKQCQTCLTKERSNPRNKRYLWIQVKERAQNACVRKTCFTKPSKRTKCFTMFDQMFDGVQILSNTISYQTRSNNTEKGKTGKCLVTKQCLITFDRQRFPDPARMRKCHSTNVQRKQFKGASYVTIFWVIFRVTEWIAFK